MTNIVFLDTETTGATNDTNGNAFTIPNKLCYIGCSDSTGHFDFDIEYSGKPYGKQLEEVRRIIDRCDLLVGFNLKFDLHWLRRYGIQSFQQKTLWDCQTFEYMASRQTVAYPSLGNSCKSRGLGEKMDIVRTEYWEKGIDTDKVPEPTLKEYLRSDVEELTKSLYFAQQQVYQTLSERLRTLIDLANQDTLTLEEMEWNGLPYDIKASFEKAAELEKRMQELDTLLSGIIGFYSCNWNSGDHLSAILYGGYIEEAIREPYLFTYKDGRVAEKSRWTTIKHIFPQLVEPIKYSKLKKSTDDRPFYSSDEATLKKLRGGKTVDKIVEYLLERAKVEKLKGTYFEGFPKRHSEMEWEDGIIHGSLNQCVTGTGRLASSGPNIQNLPDPIRGIIKTRYD